MGAPKGSRWTCLAPEGEKRCGISFPGADPSHRHAYGCGYRTSLAPSTPVPEASGRPTWEPLTLREAAIEAILIREQDTAFSTVARIIAALPAPSPEASDERPGWADLMAILDEVYPSDVFGLGHPDPGPQIVGYLRAIDKLRGRDPRPAPSSSPVGNRPWMEPSAVVDALEAMSARLTNITGTQAAQLLVAADYVRLHIAAAADRGEPTDA